MYCTDQKIKRLRWPNIKRGEHRNTGLASAESTQLVETEYMSEEGVNSPAKTTSIKGSKGKWKKKIFRERCSQRKSGWTRWWNQKQAARFRFPLCGIISKEGWMGFSFLISFLWLSEWLEESSNATKSFPPGQVAQITGLCFCVACLLIVGFYLMDMSHCSGHSRCIVTAHQQQCADTKYVLQNIRRHMWCSALEAQAFSGLNHPTID